MLFRNKKTAKGKSGISKTQRGKKSNNIRTSADSIPYIAVYENGIIEVRDNVFSKSYVLPEVNFSTLEIKEQYKFAEQYSQFLSSIDPLLEVQITLYNRTMDEDDLMNQILLPCMADNYDEYRTEFNDMLVDTMKKAKNNLKTQKIITITMPADDIRVASEKFIQVDDMISHSMNDLTKGVCVPMSIIERLDILNAIYNPDNSQPFYEKREIDGHTVESFSLENCARQGITSKDVIAPSSIVFKGDHVEIDNVVAKSYSITNYPSWIKGTFLTKFATIGTNALVSVYFKTMSQMDSIKLVKNQRLTIAESLTSAQKQAFKNGYSADLVSPQLQVDKQEADSLIDEITRNNAKLFTVTFVVTLFADSLEDMKKYESQLKLIAGMNLVTVKAMNWQQEVSLNSALPIGNNQMLLERLMTSDSVASIIPFGVREMVQPEGLYYGRNAVSGNVVMYDRAHDKINPSGCILGMPGAGKSFAAKREIVNVLMASPDDEIYIIDPEGEYSPLAQSFGGTVVKIASGTTAYINPFDLNIDNSDDDGDPIRSKTEFITSLVETMIGGKWGLSPMEASIINRAVINIYDPYLTYLKRMGLKHDPQKAPTLKDFYNEISNTPYPEAQNMALSLERYVKGTVDIFSHRSNINIENNFIVYNIKDIGPGLMESGLQVAMDHIWNKMIENSYRHKRTWVYVDEIHLLLKSDKSAANLVNIWKRARKWNGIPTAITQNVEDLLKTEAARTLLNNSPFTLVLGQTDINRQQLSGILNISPNEQRYISRPKPGTGLLVTANGKIPVEDDFPRGSKLYKLMTTRPDEKMF